MAAVRVVRVRGLTLERSHLRAPFFGQCYLAAILSGALGTASFVGRLEPPWAGWMAGVIAVLTVLGYIAAQKQLFRQALGVTLSQALRLALWVFGGALLYVFGITITLAWGL